ncbi:hypothetical protein CLV78_10442 [Aliiruegeria haliotis]|uniref:Nodulation protein Z (NodZ) n=1 Tax=Aliiruegeria haliotis TaxID=1280846 RepID=A0A2T0RQY8_9RHOB|nr:hypothetical protein [Aliiruegeria haliotis]PRY23552.1 hypothetical protein CLV78_10442 [Aliiruegeria haliotis]
MADERYLVIKGKAGLGNRMLAAVTGLVYADLSGRIPVVDWRDGAYADYGTNAYPLLFDTPATVDPARFDAETQVTPSVWSGRMGEYANDIVGDRHEGARVYRASCVDLRHLDHPEPVAVYWSYVSKLPRLRGHMMRDPRFRGRSAKEILRDYLQRYFPPNQTVRSAVDQVVDGMPSPRIGVHLRFTDMRGPLEKTVAALERLRAKMPDAPVFLATDSREAQDLLTHRFDRVTVIEKHLSDDGCRLHQPGGWNQVNLQAEAENAMVDLWTLAACDRLICSSNSTFSGVATLIGGFGNGAILDVDRINPLVRAKRWIQPFL